MLPDVATQSVKQLFWDSILPQWINFHNYPTTTIKKYLDSFLLVCSNWWETYKMEFQCLWHVIITWQCSNEEYFEIKTVSLHATLRKCVNKMWTAPCFLTSCTDFRLLWTIACPSNQQMSFLALLAVQLGWLVAFFWSQERDSDCNWGLRSGLDVVEMCKRSFLLMYLAMGRRKPWRLSGFAHLISDTDGVSRVTKMANWRCFPQPSKKK